MSEQFYIVNEFNKPEGPYTIAELQSRGITPSTLVCPVGDSQWVQAATVPQLSPIFAGKGVTVASGSGNSNRNIIFAVLIAVVVVLAGVCVYLITSNRQEPQEDPQPPIVVQQTPTPPVTSPVDTTPAQEPAKPLGENRHFKGAIGSYKITMDLNIRTLEGTYYYNKRPRSVFTLECTYSSNNRDGSMEVNLNEWTPNGEQTGAFSGTLNDDGTVYSGTFTNYDSGRTYNFNLYVQ